MATEALAEGSATEVAVVVPVPVPETGLKHKLKWKWTFYFDNQSKPKQGASWGTSLRKVYTFDTVEEFWCLYDQIFKPSKLSGSASDFHLFKDGIEPKWEAFIEDKAANEAAQMGIGRKWKEIVDANDKIT